MPAEPRRFVDTNVLVYALAADRPAKQRVASALVERGFSEGGLVVSTQVLLELYVTLTRKLAKAVPEEDAFRFVEALTAWDVVETGPALVMAALGASRRRAISVWDAAILEAARAGGCEEVLSEDLSHGQDYGGVFVTNPFRGIPTEKRLP